MQEFRTCGSRSLVGKFGLVIGAMTLTVAGSLGMTSAIAGALPPVGSCAPHCPPPPPPPPLVPSVTGVSPAYGWAGDSVEITGTDLGSTASVKFTQYPATITYKASNEVTVTVPAQITYDTPQPGAVQAVPVSVTVGSTTLSATFDISPLLTRSLSQTFDNDLGRTANTNASIDRATGLALATTTVSNDLPYLGLSVNVSILYANAQGKFIGYTAPYSDSVGACLPLPFSGCSGGGIQNVVNPPQASLEMQPNPALSTEVHSIAIVQTEVSSAELSSTLQSLYNAGSTIQSVVSFVSGL